MEERGQEKQVERDKWDGATKGKEAPADKEKMKISGVYAPKLEPAPPRPIYPADRNHQLYPWRYQTILANRCRRFQSRLVHLPFRDF